MRFLKTMAFVAALAQGSASGQSVPVDNKSGASVQAPVDNPVQIQAPGAGERELRTLHSDLARLMSKNDAQGLGVHLSDDWTFTSANGNVLAKAEFLASIKSGELKFESLTFADTKVRFYESTAVVSASSTVKAVFKGVDVHDPQRSTDIFVRDDHGRWKCVLTHVTRVAKK